MKRVLCAALIFLAGCSTVKSALTFINRADLERLAAAACGGHLGVDSVKLQATYAIVVCRDGAQVTIEYFPAPKTPTQKETP